jgi:hypothetical protein
MVVDEDVKFRQWIVDPVDSLLESFQHPAETMVLD